MAPLHLPTELVDEIVKNGDNDKATLLSYRMVSKSWSRLNTQGLLDSPSFEAWGGIREFLDILASPACTFPLNINATHVSLNGLADMNEDSAAALECLTSAIALQKSLSIQVTMGGIVNILSITAQQWGNIHQLTLSGGIHPPATFFARLAAFPELQTLTLEDFQFEEVSQGALPIQFKFPPKVVKLSLVRSSSLFTFLRSHVLPGGGLVDVEELCVETQFSYMEEGVWDMMRCFTEHDMPPMLTLRPIYEETALSDLRDLNRDMKRIFQNRDLTLARTRGIQHLHLDFSAVPAQYALGSIIIHSFYIPSSGIAVPVVFQLPLALTFWDNDDPSTQMHQFFKETQSDAISVAGVVPLIVRCPTGSLPAAVKVSESAVVCEYPVSFVE